MHPRYNITSYSLFLHVFFGTLLCSFSSLFSGQSPSDNVRQTPKDVIVQSEKSVTLSCSHSIPDYYMILWYQQLKGDTALKLIGHVLYKNPSVESQYINQSTIAGDGEDTSTLKVKLNKTGTSIVYFCAASKAQC